MENKLFAHSVVIGAGIAGLAAARALADFSHSVTVLERDAPASAAMPRAGVPQGRQPHLLMAGGLRALAALFPGLERDLRAVGALPISAGRDLRTEIPGLGVLPKRDLGIDSLGLTRPLLEQVLAGRVRGLGNVVFRHGGRATEILTTANGTRVAGVLYEDAAGRPATLGADLVIDAGGRAALTLACLRNAGRAAPRQTKMGIDIGYATGEFLIPPGAAPDFIGLVTIADAAVSSRMGYMLRIGEARWQALLVGRGDDAPPGDFDGFLDFAGTLPTRTIADTLRSAAPTGEIARFRLKQSIWRHFAERPDLPAGLIPIGDSICRLNPVYGQGMSIAAQQGKLLRDLLADRAGARDRVGELGPAFLRQTEPLIERAWMTSAIPDFVYPQTIGVRPADLEERLQRHFDLYRDAMTDPAAHRALVARNHLIETAEEAGEIAAAA